MAEDTSLWILSHMLVTKQGSKLGFLELHHAISEVVQRLIGDLVPSLVPRQFRDQAYLEWIEKKRYIAVTLFSPAIIKLLDGQWIFNYIKFNLLNWVIQKTGFEL